MSPRPWLGRRNVIDTTDNRVAVREVRAPAVAIEPLRTSGGDLPMVAEWDFETAYRMAYLSNVFVFRCVQVLAESLASLPFRVGADPAKPQDFDPKDPLALLLGPPPQGPNPTTTARSLWMNAVANYLVAGRFGWEVETPTGGDTPVGLWPLSTARLHPVPSKGGLSYWSRFVYNVGNEERTLRPDRVVYVWRPGLMDWREPESVLQAARLDVSVAVMQDRYDYAFLRNDARPAAVIVHEAFAEDEHRQAFKEQFLSNHQGVSNAGRPMFIEAAGDGAPVSQAIHIETLGLSQKDGEFIARYDAKIRAITVAFGVPLSMLGDASKRTFANADREELNFWRSRVLPLALDLADAINLQLAPRLTGKVGWFDTSGVPALAPPKRFTAVSPVDLYNAGLVSKNEIRADAGLPPVADGDDLSAPALPTPAPLALPSPTAAPARSAEDAPAMPPAVHSVRVSGPIVTETELRRRSAEQIAAEAEARRAAAWHRVDKRITNIESVWERRLRRLFAKQEQATVSRLLGKRGRKAVKGDGEHEERVAIDAASIFDPEFWRTATQDEAEQLYELVVAVAGDTLAQQFAAALEAAGIDFGLEAPYATLLIRQRANQLAGPVTQTTYEAIREAMAAGVQEGAAIDHAITITLGDGSTRHIPSLVERIRGVFEHADRVRARMIARTEVIGGYNAAAYMGSQYLPEGTVGGYEWLATRDGRTRVEHGEADGQVIALDGKFVVGGAEMQYPGDSAAPAALTVNCRCSLLTLTADEMVDRGRGRVAPVRDVSRLLAAVASRSIEPAAAMASLVVGSGRDVRTPVPQSHALAPAHPTVEVVGAPRSDDLDRVASAMGALAGAVAALATRSVEPTPVHVDVRMDPPVVNIAPSVVHVDAAPAPEVNVDVHLARDRHVERDDRGRILRIVEK